MPRSMPLFRLVLLSVFVSGAAGCAAYGGKLIRARYVPAPETTNLSDAAAEDKRIAESMDKESLLYTGRVVVDLDVAMLQPPQTVAKLEGKYFSVAKIAPEIEFGVIPSTPRFFPEPPDKHHRAMWANWGQSTYYRPNGNFYTSIGDHGSYDAHLYIVEYDPAKRVIGMSAEINEVLGRSNDVFSEGKIHGSLDFLDGPNMWFCTYWSKYPEVKPADWATGYKGGHIMSYNVETGNFVDYGVPMLRASWPASRVDTKRRMLYATGYFREFLAWDIKKGRAQWMGYLPDGMSWSNRVYLIDEVTGKVYTANGDAADLDKNLIEYNPATNRFTLLEAPMPPTEQVDGFPEDPKPTLMRCITYHRGPDRLFWGITHAGQMFSFDPEKAAIVDRGVAWPGKERYTTSIERSPDGRYLYYAPGAHGHGNRDGSPLMQWDTKTGKRKVIAFLAPFYQKTYGYTPSGAFSLKLDDKGERVFICWNGGFFKPEDTTGEKRKSLFMHNAIMLVHIPESERPE